MLNTWDITREQAEIRLNERFGHLRFKDRQWEIIETIFKEKKVLLIEKTGFGKSLCYQFPSIYFDGITLVFSPLIALMRDQVNYLRKNNISAECINSENSSEENQRIIHLASENKLDLLYIAPERQESHNWETLLSSLDVSMIVIDEAHCISVWGHDFRPTYKKLVNTIARIPDVPILGVTATATKITEEDIAKQMGDDITIIRGRLKRPNLHLHSIKTNSIDDKLSLVIQIVRKINGVGIVFAGTRAETEFISNVLNFAGIKSVHYHAGVDNRKQIENEVLADEYNCVVATNSFGMGIDKQDFRFIIHTRFPASPIHYYQEIGRAGRDGDISQIFLLWESSDVKLQEYFINLSKPPFETYYKIINYIEENPMCTQYEIATTLDLPHTMVENVISDLRDQNMLEVDVEINHKLPEYYIINDELTEIIYDELSEKLRDVHARVSDDLIKQMLKQLSEGTETEYTLARDILGRTTNSNRRIIKSMIDIIVNKNDLQQTYINVEKRVERTISYSLKSSELKLDESSITNVKQNKIDQLNGMQQYLKFSHCRMQFLCEYLGDHNVSSCGVCDYCILEDEDIRDWSKLLDLCIYDRDNLFVTTACGSCTACNTVERFFIENYPKISLVYPSEEETPLNDRSLKLLDGYAVGFDFTSFGHTIQTKKDENTKYSEDTVQRVVELYQKRIKPNYNKIDYLMYIPPVDGSSNIIGLAEMVSDRLDIAISHDLITTREITPESEIVTWRRKVNNVKNAFQLDNPSEYEGKSILMIGDVYESKAIIREIGKYLSGIGVRLIQPLYLIKIFT